MSDAPSSGSLAGRRVLVTGAAGGIGRAFCRSLALAGAALVMTDRMSCQTVLADLHGAEPAFEITADLSDRASVAQLTQAVLARGGVDVLVNNAALVTPVAFDRLDMATFDLYRQVNLDAPLMLIQALSPAMRAKGFGRIINIVSSSAWQPQPGFAAYIAAKMGLVGLTRALALEMGDEGVTINALAPGLTRHQNGKGTMAGAVWREQRGRRAIHRDGAPDDLVGTLMFLVSDASAFMTGQTLCVDGGAVLL